MQNLGGYVSNVLGMLASGNAGSAFKLFELDTFLDLVEVGSQLPQAAGRAGGQERQALTTFTRILGELMEMQKLSLRNGGEASQIYSDTSNNPFKFFTKAFQLFSKEDVYFENSNIAPFLGLYYQIVKACKVRLKEYFALKVQKLQESVDSLVSVLRDIFVEYKRSESNEGTLISLNQILWVYFRKNQFQQCTFYVQNISSQLRELTVSSKKAHVVTLLYYLGRMKLYDSNYQLAEQHLLQAYNLCHSSFKSQRLLILKFLVPVKILNGQLPSEELLSQYGLLQYVGLVEAFRTSNLAKFDEIKDRNMLMWIRLGLFFILDKIKLIMLRNITKKVWVVAGKQPIVETDHFRKAFSLKAKSEYSLEETQCIIGNLVFKGFIRGYVFPEEKKVVFSKDKGFPLIRKTISSNQNLGYLRQ